MAATVKEVLRDSDSMYRYGGEEFVVLLPNTTAHHALQVAERMRTAVSDLELQGEHLSISLGVTTFDGHNFLSSQEMLAKADAALYNAKEQGRNCSVHTQDMVPI